MNKHFERDLAKTCKQLGYRSASSKIVDCVYKHTKSRAYSVDSKVNPADKERGLNVPRLVQRALPKVKEPSQLKVYSKADYDFTEVKLPNGIIKRVPIHKVTDKDESQKIVLASNTVTNLVRRKKTEVEDYQMLDD